MTRSTTGTRYSTTTSKWQPASPWTLAQMIADALGRGGSVLIIDPHGGVQEITPANDPDVTVCRYCGSTWRGSHTCGGPHSESWSYGHATTHGGSHFDAGRTETVHSSKHDDRRHGKTSRRPRRKA